MSNKFLEKYPQLREPQIGDWVKFDIVRRNFELLRYKKGIIMEMYYNNQLNKIMYYIKCDNTMYYRSKDSFIIDNE
jgi:hypothetical protein